MVKSRIFYELRRYEEGCMRIHICRLTQSWKWWSRECSMSCVGMRRGAWCYRLTQSWQWWSRECSMSCVGMRRGAWWYRLTQSWLWWSRECSMSCEGMRRGAWWYRLTQSWQWWSRECSMSCGGMRRGAWWTPVPRSAWCTLLWRSQWKLPKTGRIMSQDFRTIAITNHICHLFFKSHFKTAKNYVFQRRKKSIDCLRGVHEKKQGD